MKVQSFMNDFNALIRNRNIYIILFFFTFSCSSEEYECKECLFESINPQHSGLDFINEVKQDSSFNIIKYLYFYNGGGVAIGDINNDGFEDILLSSNQGYDQLYLNLGNLKFKNITKLAGFNHSKGWSTGVNIVDINGDGWNDIFICRLGNFKKYERSFNLAYINNCDGTFSEKSKDMGLDFSGYSTQCAFFDMDRDGDLDAYLLNHSVKNASQFQPSHIRNNIDQLAGDILYENKNGVFHDISKNANIFQSSIGYGLGISIGDFNNDGWQDIYVGNDFHENDYLYLNLKNKTFKEICSTSFGHTSNFSMGNDCDDIDNDDYIDIFTVDMKPNDEKTYKNSGGWENLQIYNFKRSFGYHHQQPKNSFQWNRGLNENGYPIFSEISSFLNLDATDWSWSPLIFDFNLDGNKDIFITNGIKSRPNDMDFINFLTDNLQKQDQNDLSLIKSMPEGKQKNMFFLNTGNLNFKSLENSNEKFSLSNGASMCDLDNDGDYDIVTNNFDEIATLYENKLNKINPTSIELKNNSRNTGAIGAKIVAYYNNKHFVYQIKSVSGFQSSSSKKIILPMLKSNCDSLKIYWPEGDLQIIKTIQIGKHQIIEKPTQSLAKFIDNRTLKRESIQNYLPQWYNHKENDYNDQLNEPWIPYLLSSTGPRIAISSKEICYVTNSKNKNGVFFSLNSEKKYQQDLDKGLLKAMVDETNATFFDANGDGLDDLYLCLGGNEIKNGNISLSDKLYIQTKEGKFILSRNIIPTIPLNTSVAAPYDYDHDGDIDLFVGVQSSPFVYGTSTSSYLLENDSNKIFRYKQLSINEMVYDAIWEDIDKNGYKDLIVCGHWMPITIFHNYNGKLTKNKIEDSEGLWFSLATSDLNQDGYPEILAGNFGQNHSLKCSKQSPLQLFINDFDNNGKTESLLTYQRNNNVYIFPNRDMLVSVLPNKKKKFLKNHDISGKTLSEIFSKSEIAGCIIKTCKTTASQLFTYNIKNKSWISINFPNDLQISTINTILNVDKNKFAIGGNKFDIDPNIGRQDGLPLSLYQIDNNLKFKSVLNHYALNHSEITDIISVGTKLIFSVKNGGLYYIKL